MSNRAEDMRRKAHAQSQAKAILELSSDLEAVVKREVGRLVGLEIARAIDILQDAMNLMTILKVGYENGSVLASSEKGQ